MPKTYTVKNTETGQTITFAWDGEVAPTDSDYEEVFKAAKGFKAPAPEEPTQTPAGKAWGAYEKGMDYLHVPTEMYHETLGNVIPGAEALTEKEFSGGRVRPKTSLGRMANEALFPSDTTSEPLPQWAQLLLRAGAPSAADLTQQYQNAIQSGDVQGAAKLKAVAGTLLEKATDLGTDLTTALPLGSKLGALVFGPSVAAGVLGDLSGAADTYKKEGITAKFYQQLTSAGINAAFFTMIARELKSGKPVEKVLQDVQAAQEQRANGTSTQVPMAVSPESNSGGGTPVEAPGAPYGQAPAEIRPVQRRGSATPTTAEAPPEVPYGQMPAEVPAGPPQPPTPEMGFDPSRIPTYGQPAQGVPAANVMDAGGPPAPTFTMEDLQSRAQAGKYDWNSVGAEAPPEMASSDLQAAAAAAHEAVAAPVDISTLPPVPADHTRLYRGEGPLSEAGSNWFTTEPEEAGSYQQGGELLYTDVPTRWLELHNEKLGRDTSMRGEFQLPDGYVARAKNAAAPNPESGFAMNPGGVVLDIYDAVKKAATKPGAVVKGATNFLDDFLRASVAGTVEATMRNISSGVKLVGQSYVFNPVTAQMARGRAAWYRANGKPQAAREALMSAQLFSELGKSFRNVTPHELSQTALDMVGTLKGGREEHGNFGQNLELLKTYGLKREASTLRNFASVPEFNSEGFKSRVGDTAKKVLMFGNIMGDRAINRVVLAAHIDAIQKVFGVKDAQGLARLQSDPTAGPIIKNFLEYASSEATRMAWNNPNVTSGAKVSGDQITTSGQSPISQVYTAWGRIPVLGILTNPFARSFAANYLPNIVEMSPGLHLLSKRVRNSYAHNSLDILHQEVQAKMRNTPSGSTAHTELANKLAEITRTQRELRDSGVYSLDSIHTRTMLGPLVTAAAFAWRMMKGDDKTEFDEMGLGKAPSGGHRNAAFTGSVGEWLPYIFVGDWLAHKQMGTGKYDGKEGSIALARVAQAFYGSRYGYTNPSGELLQALYEGLFQGKNINSDYLNEMAGKILGGVGKMAGAGGWIGSAGRGLAAAASPEEAKLRRDDLSIQGGFQSQIPIWRQNLPESIQWLNLKHGENPAPLENMLTGLTQRDRGEIEEFINSHQGKLSAGAVSPHRTQDPTFDELMLAEYAKNVRGKVLPYLHSPGWDAKSDEEKIAEFTSTMKQAREAAKREALRKYKSEKGTLPDVEMNVQLKGLERKETKKEARGAPRFIKRPKPKASKSQLQEYQNRE